jgi:hypothetical protein
MSTLHSLIAALATVLTLAIPVGPSAAQTTDDAAAAILGRWITPGGNTVLIRKGSNGQIEGRLVGVTDEQKPYGFKQQDLVLTGFEINGAEIKFAVGVRIDEANRPDCEMKYQRFGGTLASDSIPGKVSKAHFEGCELVVEDGEDTVAYRRSPQLQCMELPDFKPIFNLSRHGPQAVTAEASVGAPLAEKAPSVELKTGAAIFNGKTAVSGAEVEWQLSFGEKVYTTYYTDTDDNGIAELQFVLQPDGGFAPAFQIRQRPQTVPAGKYSVVARVPSLDTPPPNLRPGQIAPAPPPPVTFDLELKRNGLLLNFLDETGSTPVSLLSWPDSLWAKPSFRLELVDFNDTEDAAEKSITIKSYDGNNALVETRDFTVKRKGRGIYRYDGKPINAKFVPPGGVKIPHPLSEEIYVTREPITKIEASHGNTVNTIKLYDKVRTIRRERIKQILDRYQQNLDGIRSSAHVMGPAQADALAYKQSLIDRARSALGNAKLGIDSSGPILVAEAFMNLLPEKDRGPPDTLHNRYIWQMKGAGSESIQNPDMSLMMDVLEVKTANERRNLNNAQRDYWNKAEEGDEAAGAALNHVLGVDIKLPTNEEEKAAAIRQILSNGAITIGKGVASIVFAKELGLIYGAWILATGTTLDGENAGAIDYMSAGLDVVSFDLHTGPSEWITKSISRKVHKLEEIRSVAAGVAKAAGRANAAFDDLRYASQVVRMKNGLVGEIWTIAKSTTISFEEQVAQISRLMTRIPNPDVAKLMSQQFAEIPGVLNRRIGVLLHRQKNLETRAFLDMMSEAGKVTKVAPGRYRWTAVVNGVEATYEEFSEFRVASSRIDGALAKISKNESFTLIRDLTAKLTNAHWAKGEEYKVLMESVVDGLKGVPASYCEYYWTETSPAALKSQLDQY